MTSAERSEEEWLRESASKMGLELSDGVVRALLRYLDLLGRWNAVYNLTAVRDRATMRTHHLLDCLAIVEPLRRMASDLHPSLPRRILDVGSGGGLPGVILALLLPEWSVVCVDTVGKKAAFVQQVAAELATSNLQALQTRVEVLQAPPFGVITARAFSSLSQLVDAAGRHLAPSGLYLAMKGKVPQDELQNLQRRDASATVFHVEQLAVPGLNADRCIVWLRAGPPAKTA